MSSSCLLPKNRPLIGRMDRSENQRPIFGGKPRTQTHVLTQISEKTDFSTGCPVTIVLYLDLLPTIFVFIEFYWCFWTGWTKDLARPAAEYKTALQKSYKNYYLSAI